MHKVGYVNVYNAFCYVLRNIIDSINAMDTSNVFTYPKTKIPTPDRFYNVVKFNSYIDGFYSDRDFLFNMLMFAPKEDTRPEN
jgi:hypothetical protein